MKKEQIEMSLENRPRLRPAIGRQRRLRRAHWWFQQMREVVDRALDRDPAPPARPEQIYFSLQRSQPDSEASEQHCDRN